MIQISIYLIFTLLVLIIAKKYLDKKGHPKALFYLFFAEMWERFSFYGMRALLVLYIIKSYMSDIENNEDIAYGIYASYGALVYLTPLIGGYLADKFIGYRKSILFGGVLMALGHFFMAFETDFFFYGALGLLIMGNGFFKPNISSLVGSLYEDGDQKRDSGFTIFYMGINLGAMIAPLLCGYLGEVYGWHYGFGAAGFGMLAGLIVFWKGISDGVMHNKGLQPKEFISKKISGLNIDKFVYIFGFLAVPLFAYLIYNDVHSGILGGVLSVVGIVVLVYLLSLVYTLRFKENNKIQSDRLIAIMILCVFLTIFWGCFEISGSAITVWADKCVNLFGINASQSNAINPFYIVLLAIPFSWIWTKLDSGNRNPSTPAKFSLGILQLGLGFLVLASSFYFNIDGKVSMIFLFLGYLLITTGELFLSPIGLSKVTQLAPKRMISFIMGVWFLSSTFAHYISGGISKLTSKEFYTETNIFTLKNNNSTDMYVFDLDFDFKNNIKSIKKIEKYDNVKNEYLFLDISKFDSLEMKNYEKEISNINLLIIKEIIENKDSFWWDIKTGSKNKGQLLLTMKSMKNENDIPEERLSLANGIQNELLDKIKEVDETESLMTSIYQTTESIDGNNDAIAGISFVSKDILLSEWNGVNHKNNLPAQLLPINLTTSNNMTFNYNLNIKPGPSDFLSKFTYSLLGNPVIEGKSIATLLQYNIVFMKIGIVTVIISILIILISPFIRRLMHGIH